MEILRERWALETCNANRRLVAPFSVVDHRYMLNREKKISQDRQDTLVLLTGMVVVGTFISLMANMIPLAILIAGTSVYYAKKVLS